jgi:ketosteroid isomerase-like protein
MPQEPTAHDLVGRLEASVRAGNERDIDAALSLYAPDAVWDMAPLGMGTYEGVDAIRGFFEDWLGAYEEYRLEAEEVFDLGYGVLFAVLHQGGRPSGSSGAVQLRYATVCVWVRGVMARITSYSDIDEARLAAERLAAEWAATEPG